ncbi:MAG: permease [Spirochaetaceae bacterium 4572_59]|nr:MAG: permease [Spirochaetaceae bacterium 4572_59]
MKKLVKRFRPAIIMVILFLSVLIFVPAKSSKAVQSLMDQLKTMLFVIPPVFILLGLFDVWVPREYITRHLGEGSGIKGILMAFFLGSAAAGPLYGAFPVAAVMAKKGSSLFNILIFIGAWSTTKIPMFLFEFNAMGARFAVSRLFVSISGIIMIALIINLSLSHQQRTLQLERAAELTGN